MPALKTEDITSVQTSLSDKSSEEKPSKLEISNWKKVVSEFEKPSLFKSLWQLITTLGLYLLTWTMIYLNYSKSGPWYLYIPLILFGAGLTVRIFIIFHDCGHQSFFKKQKYNKLFGFITGTLAFTPFKHWTWEHNVHHATVGDIDRRGIGDVWTLMVNEYLELPKLKRLSYRIWRHPLFLFGFAPVYAFLIRERIPSPGAKPGNRKAVIYTNIAILLLMSLGCLAFGSFIFLLFQLFIISIAASAGVWLFYVQHQFEGVYWERHEHWEYTSAALDGSSFYQLPKVLQWFSGNIGYHHLHHLSTKIPNYHLEACHNSHPAFAEVTKLTLFSSFRCMNFRLWDETEKALITWKQFKRIRDDREAALSAA